jgi:hypothetical protein
MSELVNLKALFHWLDDTAAVRRVGAPREFNPDYWEERS